MPMIFIIDSREKRPYHLPGSKVARLTTGDYTIEGFEGVFAIERKSFEDLYRCITSSIKRFRSQLKRLGGLPSKALLLDTTVSAILLGHPMCRLSGEDALVRIIALTRQYDIPMYFCDRQGSTFCRLLLCRFWKEEHSVSAG